MAGMNFHQVGTEPPPPVVTPPRPRMYHNNNLVYDFVIAYSEDRLACTRCARTEFTRNIYERWARSERVDLSNITGDPIEIPDLAIAADISSAEYDDEEDEDRWACAGCSAFIDINDPLHDLLTDLEKETY